MGNRWIIKLETYAVNTNARNFYRRNAHGEPGVVIVKPLMDTEEWCNQLKAKAK